MARGDIHIFASYMLKAKSGVALNFSTDTLKLGIVNNTAVPTVSTADPRWGTGGSTDFSANQVATGTGYAGPITLTSVTYIRNNGVNTLAAANISIPQDASGFTNGYYGILYDDTAEGKYAIGFVDLGGPVSLTSGALNINWNASGIFTETAS